MLSVFGIDRLFEILVAYFKERPESRKPTGIISGITCFVALGYIITLVVIYEGSPEPPLLTLPALGLGLPGAAVLLSVLASYTNIFTTTTKSSTSTEAELADLAQARVELERRIRESRGGDIYSNLELNLNHISEYYIINKSHARNSFRIGAFAVVLGFIAILAGIGLLYFGEQGGSSQVPLVAGIAGLLGQFIGGYCFYLYNRATLQIATFYGRLSQVQDTMLAVKLCDAMEDQQQKSTIMSQIISALLARSTYPMPTVAASAPLQFTAAASAPTS